MSVLVEAAEGVRIVDKTRRQVWDKHTRPTHTQCSLNASFLRSLVHLQAVLKNTKLKIGEFFEDGVSCCLPLDPAVRVKALDVEV